MTQHHIAFVIEKLTGRKGGAERVVFDVANGLYRRGHRVSILHYDEHQGVLPYVPEQGVEVYNLCSRPLLAQTRRVSLRLRQKLKLLAHSEEWTKRYSPLAKELSLFARAHAVDAIVGVMPPAIAAVEMGDFDSHIIKAASVHNSPYNEYENGHRWGMGSYGAKRRLKSIKTFSRVGVLLPEFKEWHDAVLSSPSWVIPNMIHPVPQHEQANPENSSVIVSVGRLVDCKQHALMLEAWNNIRHFYPQWSIELYGDGPLKNALEQQLIGYGIAPQTVLKGTVDNVASVYKKAAFLAHPAAQEGLPLVVGEALAKGLPVLGFETCPGVNTFVKHKSNGLLVSDQQARASFEKGLRDLIDNVDLRATLGKNAKQSLSDYTPTHVLELWEKFLSVPTQEKSS